jgi:hypothetical protein
MSTLKNLAAPRRFLTNQLFNISRYHELQQKYDDISVGNQTLEEQIHFKDNEIEVSNILSSDMLWLSHWNPKYTCLFSCTNSCVALHVWHTRKNTQLVTSQDMFALLCLCSELVDKLSTAYSPFATIKIIKFVYVSFSCLVSKMFQVVPTTCYRPAIQQLVNKLRMRIL